MPTDDEIQNQQTRLTIHRKNLAVSLQKLATFGTPHVPPYVVHEIEEACAAIDRIKAILRAWDVVVKDHPDDGVDSTPFTRPSPPAQTPALPLAFRKSGITQIPASTHLHESVCCPIIGRSNEMDTLCAWLMQPAKRLITLTGVGGIGKTHLAHASAAETRAAFADGVYCIDLSALNHSSFVLPAIAQTLKVAEGAGISLLDVLQAYLRDRQMLIILDSFERVMAAAADVGLLLAIAPSLKLLITSRELLCIKGEYHYEVPPLTVPDEKDPPALIERYGAVQLFVERVRALKHDVVVDHTTLPLIAAICCLVQGIPLAIELVTARMRMFSLDQLVERLRVSLLPVLTHGNRDLPVRHRTMSLAIEWSYNCLGRHEQRIFRQLGVMLGHWSLDTVIALYTGDHQPGKKPQRALIERVIESLVEKSLVKSITDGDGTAHFMMYDVIRAYALNQLEAKNEATAMRQSHAWYYLHVAEQAAPELTKGNQHPWLTRLEYDHPNLRAALTWLLDQADAPRALQFVNAVWKFWQFHNHYSEGCSWIARALTLDALGPPTPARGRALLAMGWLASDLGDHTQATASFNEGLTILKLLDDQTGIMLALHGVGLMALLNGHIEQAQADYLESLQIAQSLGDTEEKGWSYQHLAGIAAHHEDFNQEVEFHQHSLDCFREVEHHWGMVWSLMELCHVLLVHGQRSKANQYVDELQSYLKPAWRDARLLARAKSLCGFAACERRQHTDAIALLRDSVKSLRELGGDYCLTWALAFLGLATMCHPQETEEAAEALLGQAVTVALESQNVPAVIWAASLLGHHARAQNDEDSARRWYGLCMAWCADHHMTIGGIQGIEGIARLIVLTHPRDAVRLMGAAAKIREDRHALPLMYQRDLINDCWTIVETLLDKEAVEISRMDGRGLDAEHAILVAQELASARPMET